MIKKKKKRKLTKIGKIFVLAVLLLISSVILIILLHTTDFKSDETKYTPVQNNYDSVIYFIDSNHPVGSDYVPSDLVNVTDEIQLRAKAADALSAMMTDAENEGITLSISAGYRSYEEQKQYYDALVNQKGETAANKTAALPGYAEAETGLAVEFSDHLNISSLNWLKTNAYLYGFIQRYPKGKESITGYDENPYLYRYVGTDIANAMHNISSDETMEEFFSENS